MKIAIISVTENGRKISEKISGNLDNCTCYALEKYCVNEIPFSGMSELISGIFGEYEGFIFICACGIAIRAVASHIKSKFTDPAVIAIDEQGKFAVSLLSGHIGGANALTNKISEIVNTVPVITTATDISGKFSPDSFAIANRLYICERDLAKKIAVSVIDGKKIGFESKYTYINMPDIFVKDSDLGISVSDSENDMPFKETLHLIPRNIVIGIGCKKDTPPEMLEAFILGSLQKKNIPVRRVCGINSIDAKKDELAILNFSKKYKISVAFYTAERLMKVSGNFSSSEFVKDTVGADNVCERSAAVTKGKIIIPKQSENGMTFAAAEIPVTLDFEKEIM